MYSQLTPMEIDILFQLADCRHPDGFDMSSNNIFPLFISIYVYVVFSSLVIS